MKSIRPTIFLIAAVCASSLTASSTVTVTRASVTSGNANQGPPVYLASGIAVQADTQKAATAQNPTDEFASERAPVTGHHQIVVGGDTLRYTTTAGRLVLKPEDGPGEGALFFTAYTLDGVDSRNRPLTFAFNGGPGTGTVWLHLGALGPKKIKLESEGFVPAPPYSVVDNADTILDKTDLVFVDAPGTGFSRIKPELIKKYYSIGGDAAAFGLFIRQYLTRYQRWHSPLFLFGESYGTTRAAALVNYLIDDAIPVSGVALLSVGLDFQTLEPGNLNDLPYVLIVPSYTMIAAYHRRLAPELTSNLDATIKKVEEWCSSQYAEALAKGSSLDPAQRERVIDQLSAYTGLSKSVIDENDLRIAAQTFMNNLLKDKHLVVGRVDGRFTGPAPGSISNVPFYDPAMAAMFPAFSAVMNDYAETELDYNPVVPYKIYDGPGVEGRWDWGQAMSGYPQTAGALSSAMAKNRYLRVLVMEGMYDLATPFYASTYTFNHLHINPDYLKNITFADFRGGHMVYNDAAAIKEMKRALDKFYGETLALSK